MLNKLSSLFSKNSDKIISDYTGIGVDIHSHLIPTIDDGVKSVDEAIEIITQYIQLGYKRIITTPHIMKGTYNNNPTIIKQAAQTVRNAIQAQQLPIQFDVAAEYYMDAYLLEQLQEEELLSFGNQHYLLVEMSYMHKHNDYQNILLNLSQTKYQPILAHPERYLYLYDKGLNEFRAIKNMGVLLQINLFSVLGVYGDKAKAIAEQLIQEKLVDFIGTDIHKPKHLKYVEDALSNKYIQRLIQSNTLKNSLLLD